MLDPSDIRRSLRSLVRAEARVNAARERLKTVCRELAARSRPVVMTHLVARRRALGLSVAQVAARMGMPRPSVARLETARRGNPTLDTLVRYAAAVGAVLHVEILGGDWRDPQIDWSSDHPR